MAGKVKYFSFISLAALGLFSLFHFLLFKNLKKRLLSCSASKHTESSSNDASYSQSYRGSFFKQ